MLRHPIGANCDISCMSLPSNEPHTLQYVMQLWLKQARKTTKIVPSAVFVNRLIITIVKKPVQPTVTSAPLLFLFSFLENCSILGELGLSPIHHTASSVTEADWLRKLVHFEE